MVITGRAVVLLSLGIFPVLMAPSLATIIWVTSIAGLITCVDMFLAVSGKHVGITRDDVGSIRLTGSTESVLNISAPERRGGRFLIRDAWVPSAGAVDNRHLITIPAQERRRVVTTLHPTRRGTLPAAHVTVRSYGPLGLAARQHSRQLPGTVSVLPEFASRIHLPSRIAMLREMDGRTLVNMRGAGSEFDSLREYSIGDDIRAIDWQASARRADVLVRTWRPERDRRVVIVVDASRVAAARLADAPRLDASIEASLLLTALAHEAGDRVEVIAYHRQEVASVSVHGNIHALAAVGKALADVNPELAELNWSGLLALLRSRLNQRALVVFLTSLEVGSGDGLVTAARHLAQHHQVLIGAAHDPELTAMRTSRANSDETYQAAAATRTDLQRDALAGILRRSGAEVRVADPDQLPPTIADAYLELKRHGKL